MGNQFATCVLAEAERGGRREYGPEEEEEEATLRLKRKAQQERR